MTANHKDMANAIRFLSVDAVQAAKSGHPGMPMGMADVATVLYTKFLKFDPKAPHWHDRDRFVLSAGHGSMLMYSLLYLAGYDDMSMDDIRNFRQMGAKTAGHPEYGHVEGVETTTGPLGQGITTAVGMALAEKMMNARYGDDAVDHYTYTIAGDGCLMEGISQEAISIAGHMKLNKLVVMWDDNEICIDGNTNMTLSDNQCARFEASGWATQQVDGHDAGAIEAAIEKAKASDKPTMIACKTTIGYGAPTKAGTHDTHGAPLGDEEIKGMREGLGWQAAEFEIPDDVLEGWRTACARGSVDREAWEGRVAGIDGEFNRTMSGDLPGGWEDALNAFKKQMAEEAPKLATRQASGKVLEVLTAAVPEMIGGSADLTGSVNTKTPSTESISNTDFSGRYIHYGVREHAMGAIMNGMTLHGGFIPYAGTFAVFANYMMGAIRLSALMEKRVVYVLTHDSIGLGEDGPTHQPVETLAMLRSMPNFNTMRPCDIVETAECWQVALKSDKTPTGMVLTRQGLAPQRTTHSDENLSAKGAYVLAEADGDRKVTLLATGSEVEIASAARDMLQADGIPTAVVSMPCWELFDAQDDAYRASVLGEGTVKVGIEAAMRFGWDKYIGPEGGFVGMTGFGASAPAPELYKHFGITAENAVAEAKARL
ncbi:MAG: transketolase [Rhodospirillaceae bacterium]|jgi:transketolase|nr:transketolase [Rhodospirillaceae bacterium]MBT4218687.1 transketolase [Rhodospirillaceae bacterium]MBT5309351.1 transketolase [Rhodospirillaceae bacterium]MBT6406772.1 transketolase [Rhodospirillaceae bacterium]MBT7356429.1 transketolase [Rhodospirillaceae bacterium]